MCCISMDKKQKYVAVVRVIPNNKECIAADIKRSL